MVRSNWRTGYSGILDHGKMIWQMRRCLKYVTNRSVRSEKYPFTIFVAPFIPQEQRDLLAAAGALVRELPTVDWHSTKLTDAR